MVVVAVELEERPVELDVVTKGENSLKVALSVHLLARLKQHQPVLRR